MNVTRRSGWIALAGVLLIGGPAEAAEWFVAAGGSGSGASTAPFGRIQDALNAAEAGDTVTVRAGTYAEALRTVRGGLAGQPIRLRVEGTPGSVVVTTKSTSVFRIAHPHIVVEGLVFDGQYGAHDTLLISSTADFLTLRHLEVRRSSKDLIDMGAPETVLIEHSLIHHALNAAGGRTDAHGIVAGAVRNLTIRDTEIHTFSGDGVQVDPGRAAPGWSGVTIERARIWLEPLPAKTNGFAAGVVPGENAVDTKANASAPRATLTIRDTMAWGFRNGLITNMAAFNLKENVNVTLDGITVYDSEIAFRTRGPGKNGGARVTVQNAVVYDTQTAFRYEDNIETLNVWNTTIGAKVTRAFQSASSGNAGLDIRNLLVLGALPSVATDASNLGVGVAAFVNAATHNYALAADSAAIDTGDTVAQVTGDRAGTARPQRNSYDVGAYEAPGLGSGGDDIVVHAAQAISVQGNWQGVADTTAASGVRLWHPEAGRRFGKSESPAHYFEVTAWVEAGTPYRLWLRGKAHDNSTRSDSVWVQFSSSVNAKGHPVYRTGTTSAARVILADCKDCTVSGWGWQDNGFGVNKLGPLLRFGKSGLETIRFQTFEDGFSIDQIVLSPSTYLKNAPGALKNDTTILPMP
ncbi:MAG TPA: choice-of-anchor Q domain-containing protein [Vicinamibacterales bacterium]|nr:choice-of-anchor Q domain-containing protein [Vicinamibacterales bacterium]